MKEGHPSEVGCQRRKLATTWCPAPTRQLGRKILLGLVFHIAPVEASEYCNTNLVRTNLADCRLIVQSEAI